MNYSNYCPHVDEQHKRVDLFKSFMGSAGIILPETTSKLIHMGFFDMPASTKYHGNHEGGLFEHSYEVAKNLVYLTNTLELEWERPESPYIVGMFHDLCKVDQYLPVIKSETTTDLMTGWTRQEKSVSGWEYNPYTLLKGHGDKSVMMLSTLMQLTDEEVACIRYHMGAFTDKEQWDDYTRAVKKYPNVLWTHTADMIASQIEGV